MNCLKAAARPLVAAGLLIGLAHSPVTAQEPTSGQALTAQEYIDYLTALSTQSLTRVRSRATTLGIPSGFSTPHGVGYIAVSGSNQRERIFGSDLDGSMSFGLGLGDAAKTVGVDLSIGLTSVGKSSGSGGFEPSDVGDSGTFNVKVARIIPSPFNNGVASIAAGVGRLHRWGDAESTDPSYYLAGSSTFLVPTGQGPLQGVMTAGLATNIGTAGDQNGGFIGAGIGLNQWVSVGGSFYGDEIVAGLNTFHKLGSNVDLQFNLSYGDVTHRNSDGRVVFSAVLIGSNLFK